MDEDKPCSCCKQDSFSESDRQESFTSDDCTLPYIDSDVVDSSDHSFKQQSGCNAASHVATKGANKLLKFWKKAKSKKFSWTSIFKRHSISKHKNEKTKQNDLWEVKNIANNILSDKQMDNCSIDIAERDNLEYNQDNVSNTKTKKCDDSKCCQEVLVDSPRSNKPVRTSKTREVSKLCFQALNNTLTTNVDGQFPPSFNKYKHSFRKKREETIVDKNNVNNLNLKKSTSLANVHPGGISNISGKEFRGKNVNDLIKEVLKSSFTGNTVLDKTDSQKQNLKPVLKTNTSEESHLITNNSLEKTIIKLIEKGEKGSELIKEFDQWLKKRSDDSFKRNRHCSGSNECAEKILDKVSPITIEKVDSPHTKTTSENSGVSNAKKSVEASISEAAVATTSSELICNKINSKNSGSIESIIEHSNSVTNLTKISKIDDQTENANNTFRENVFNNNKNKDFQTVQNQKDKSQKMSNVSKCKSLSNIRSCAEDNNKTLEYEFYCNLNSNKKANSFEPNQLKLNLDSLKADSKIPNRENEASPKSTDITHPRIKSDMNFNSSVEENDLSTLKKCSTSHDDLSLPISKKEVYEPEDPLKIPEDRLQKTVTILNERQLEGYEKISEPCLRAIYNDILQPPQIETINCNSFQKVRREKSIVREIDDVFANQEFRNPIDSFYVDRHEREKQLQLGLMPGELSANKCMRTCHEDLYVDMVKETMARQKHKEKMNLISGIGNTWTNSNYSFNKPTNDIYFEDPFLKRLRGLYTGIEDKGEVRNMRKALDDIMNQPAGLDTQMCNARPNASDPKFVKTSMTMLEPGIEAGSSTTVGAERCRFYWVPQEYRDFLRVTDHPISSDYFPADNRSSKDRRRDGVGAFSHGGRPRFCVILVREFFHVNLYLRMHPNTGNQCYAQYTVLLWGRDRIPVAHYRTPVPIPFLPGSAHNVATLSCPAMLDILSQNYMTVVVYLTYFPKWKRPEKPRSELWYTSNAFSLKSSGHPERDRSKCELLLRTKRYSDLKIIVCGDNVLNVHRSVVCAESSVIRKILENSALKNRVVVLPGFDSLLSARQFIYYLYAGKIGPENIEDYDGVRDNPRLCTQDPPPRWVQVLDQLCAGIRYRVAGLVRRCSCWLVQRLEIGNVATIFLVASTADIEHLKSTTRNFLLKNLEKVKRTPGWKEMQTHPKVISDLLMKSSERKQSKMPEKWIDPLIHNYDDTPLHDLTCFTHIPTMHHSACCIPRPTDPPGVSNSFFNNVDFEHLLDTQREVEHVMEFVKPQYSKK